MRYVFALTQKMALVWDNYSVELKLFSLVIQINFVL